MRRPPNPRSSVRSQSGRRSMTRQAARILGRLGWTHACTTRGASVSGGSASGSSSGCIPCSGIEGRRDLWKRAIVRCRERKGSAANANDASIYMEPSTAHDTGAVSQVSSLWSGGTAAAVVRQRGQRHMGPAVRLMRADGMQPYRTRSVSNGPGRCRSHQDKASHRMLCQSKCGNREAGLAGRAGGSGERQQQQQQRLLRLSGNRRCFRRAEARGRMANQMSGSDAGSASSAGNARTHSVATVRRS